MVYDQIVPKNVTASGAVVASPTDFFGAHLTAGSAAATVTLYDNAGAASGTVLATLAAAIGTGDDVTLPGGTHIACKNGVYAALSGTGASLTIYTAG